MKFIKKSKFLYDWLNECRAFFIGFSIISFLLLVLTNMSYTEEESCSATVVCIILLLIMNFTWIYSIVCSIYINKHPEKFAYGEPYIVALYYVKNVKVFSDLSKAENIYNASKSKAEEIVVQRTYKKIALEK